MNNNMNKMMLISICLLIPIVLSFTISIAGQKHATRVKHLSMIDRFTVRSTDSLYNSPLIGNGEIVTTVGPTGYHNGYCPAEEAVNRTIFWAGRRLKNARDTNIRIPRVPPEELIGPTRPLIRFGRLSRTLSIDGMKTNDNNWEQILDCDNGMVISILNHNTIREQTQSFVCLTANVFIFHTQLTNLANVPSHLEFTVNYEFGDAEGSRTSDTRLHIRRPHPNDLPFGNVEGIRSLEPNLENRPPHLNESLKIHYDVNDQLGEVHIGRYPLGRIRETDTGGEFFHKIELEPNKSTDLWFWLMLSDRFRFSYFPDYERMLRLFTDHKRAWKDFWNTSHVEFGNPELEAIRKSCLYDIRCNASPWYVPPGYLSTTWEGRTLHDEFYPFMALLTGNYADLAERTPNNRLRTLPVAMHRGCGRGAYYAWESTEEGEDSAPYGHWTDERFIAGIFSEEAWQYYLHTRDLNDLARYYPVIRECAQWLIHDVIRRDELGRLGTRLIADMNETIYPVKNSLFLLCAIIRSMENAVRAAQLLNVDAAEQKRWLGYANELRQILPSNKDGYCYLGDMKVPFGPSNMAMVFPFPFDVHGGLALRTGTSVYHAIQAGQTKLNWIWTIGRLATIFFYQGRADEGYNVLKHAASSVGPFLAPNEQYRKDKGPYLAWYTVGAGAFTHAVHSMFIQVLDENDAIIFPALPSAIKNARFDCLLASHKVAVSGQIMNGKVTSLKTHSDRSIVWNFRVPKHIASTIRFASDVKIAKKPDEQKLIRITCKIKKGVTELVR